MIEPHCYEVRRAAESDLQFVPSVASAIDDEVAAGAIGIARRSAADLASRIRTGEAIIALAAEATSDHAPAGADWAGFCYVAAWEEGRFVSTSGLIVAPQHRGRGLAKRLKERALELAAERYPGAIAFGLSTSSAVARINEELGFRAASYSALPADSAFWDGCRTCPLHADLVANERRTCHCRAVIRELPDRATGCRGGR